MIQRQQRDRGRDSQLRARPRLNYQPQGATKPFLPPPTTRPTPAPGALLKEPGVGGGRGGRRAGKKGLWLQGRVLQLQWGVGGCGGDLPKRRCAQTHIWELSTEFCRTFGMGWATTGTFRSVKEVGEEGEGCHGGGFLLFLRPFPGNEAHKHLWRVPTVGFWVGVKKFMLRKFMCFSVPHLGFCKKRVLRNLFA